MFNAGSLYQERGFKLGFLCTDVGGLIPVAGAAGVGIVISVMGIPVMNDNRHGKLKALSQDYLL